MQINNNNNIERSGEYYFHCERLIESTKEPQECHSTITCSTLNEAIRVLNQYRNIHCIKQIEQIIRDSDNAIIDRIVLLSRPGPKPSKWKPWKQGNKTSTQKEVTKKKRPTMSQIRNELDQIDAHLKNNVPLNLKREA